MKLPKTRTIYYAPARIMVDCSVFIPTRLQIIEGIEKQWWESPDNVPYPVPEPIDRHWSWSDAAIEYGSITLKSLVIAVKTGDNLIQGAMLLSTTPVSSGLPKGDAKALFVERLFTAPWNRRNLRTDNRDYYKGVGRALLQVGVSVSRSFHCRGCLRLDGSPDFLNWYHDLGFEFVPDVEPISFEGVQYTPMSLPAVAARALLRSGK